MFRALLNLLYHPDALLFPSGLPCSSNASAARILWPPHGCTQNRSALSLKSNHSIRTIKMLFHHLLRYQVSPVFEIVDSSPPPAHNIRRTEIGTTLRPRFCRRMLRKQPYPRGSHRRCRSIGLRWETCCSMPLVTIWWTRIKSDDC